MINKYIKIAAVFILALVLAAPVSALDLGDKAPKTDVEMKNANGDKVSIADIQGDNGTLVIFTCNSCPWAKAWEDRIVEIGNEFQQKGVGVIAINSNDPSVNSEDSFDVMKQRVSSKGYNFPYVVDPGSQLARAFNASKTPEAFLFDESGQLVYHGTVDDDAYNPNQVEERYLREALQAVSNDNKVAKQKTKAIGCSIKFQDA